MEGSASEILHHRDGMGTCLGFSCSVKMLPLTSTKKVVFFFYLISLSVWVDQRISHKPAYVMFCQLNIVGLLTKHIILFSSVDKIICFVNRAQY